jgi:hypothetical protein
VAHPYRDWHRGETLLRSGGILIRADEAATSMLWRRDLHILHSSG